MALTHLVAYNQRLALGIPGQRKGLTQASDFVDAILCSHVPELDGSIIAHATELSILDGVKGDLLDGRRVALELG